MNTVYILLMLWTSGVNKSITVVQQEFSSYAACETARLHLSNAHGSALELRSQGCFKK
jgi:hypothetical protein